MKLRFSFLAFNALTLGTLSPIVQVSSQYTPSVNWSTVIPEANYLTRLLHDASSESYWVGTSPAFLVNLDKTGSITKTVDLNGGIVQAMSAYRDGNADSGAIQMVCIVVRNGEDKFIQIYRPETEELSTIFKSTEDMFVRNYRESANPVFSPDGQTVYVTFEFNFRTGLSRAIDTSTGDVRWTFPETPSINNHYNGFAIAPDGSFLYAGVRNDFCNDATVNGVHAINPSTGEIVHRWDAPNPCICPASLCNHHRAPPIVDTNGDVYLNDDQVGIQKMEGGDAIPNGPVWNNSTIRVGQTFFSPSLGSDDTRVYSGYANAIGGFLSSNGTADFLKTPFPFTAGTLSSSPIWGPSAAATSDLGAVYVIAGLNAGGDSTFCYDAVDGTQLWSATRFNQLAVVSDSEMVAIGFENSGFLPPTPRPLLAWTRQCRPPSAQRLCPPIRRPPH